MSAAEFKQKAIQCLVLNREKMFFFFREEFNGKLRRQEELAKLKPPFALAKAKKRALGSAATSASASDLASATPLDLQTPLSELFSGSLSCVRFLLAFLADIFALEEEANVLFRWQRRANRPPVLVSAERR